jgi:hypothetical protein
VHLILIHLPSCYSSTSKRRAECKPGSCGNLPALLPSIIAPPHPSKSGLRLLARHRVAIVVTVRQGISIVQMPNVADSHNAAASCRPAGSRERKRASERESRQRIPTPPPKKKMLKSCCQTGTYRDMLAYSRSFFSPMSAWCPLAECSEKCVCRGVTLSWGGEERRGEGAHG